MKKRPCGALIVSCASAAALGIVAVSNPVAHADVESASSGYYPAINDSFFSENTIDAAWDRSGSGHMTTGWGPGNIGGYVELGTAAGGSASSGSILTSKKTIGTLGVAAVQVNAGSVAPGTRAYVSLVPARSNRSQPYAGRIDLFSFDPAVKTRPAGGLVTAAASSKQPGHEVVTAPKCVSNAQTCVNAAVYAGQNAWHTWSVAKKGDSFVFAVDGTTFGTRSASGGNAPAAQVTKGYVDPFADGSWPSSQTIKTSPKSSVVSADHGMAPFDGPYKVQIALVPSSGGSAAASSLRVGGLYVGQPETGLPDALTWPVRFHPLRDGVERIDSRAVSDGQAIGDLPSATDTKAWLSIIGWYTSPSLADNTKVDASTTVQAPIDLYAKWGKSQQITLKSSGHGRSFPSATVGAGGAFELPRNADPDYAFTGWYWDKDLHHKIAGSESAGDGSSHAIVVTKPTTIYAGWKKADYTISLDATTKGSVDENRIGALYNSPVVVPDPTPTAAAVHDRFAGWVHHGQKIGSPVTLNAATAGKNYALSARFVPKTYHVVLNLGEHGSRGQKVINATYGETLYPSAYALDSIFVLTKWTGPGGRTVREPLTVTGDTWLTAVWGKSNISVKFVLGGHGGKDYTRAALSGSPLTLKAPTDPHYEFEGWYSDPSFSPDSRLPFQGFVNVLPGLSLYAKWKPATFTTSFDTGASGQKIAPVGSTWPNEITLPTPTAPEGFVFDGWSDGKSQALLPGGSSYKPGATATLRAVWSKAAHTVSFVMSGHGTDIAPATVDNGTSLTLPTPVASGVTFDGWYLDAGFTRPAGRSVTPTKDLTVYAKWSNDDTAGVGPQHQAADAGSSTSILPIIVAIIGIIAAILASPLGRNILPPVVPGR